jgi:hypothetical protein
MTRAKKNLAGLTADFQGINVHKNFLNGLEKDQFISGMDALAKTFKSIYAGMIKQPKIYAMKNDEDVKENKKNMYFLLLLARKGTMKSGLLEIDGKVLAPALKNAKVTKPEMYFKIMEPLGFTSAGLGKKIETSEKITVEFPGNNYLLFALKAMADAIGMFSKGKPHQGNIYFELLDHRVLENYPAIEPKATMEFILSKLKSEGRDVVEMFYEFITPLAKCKIKGSFEWYWTPVFTLKSSKKVIMSFKLTQESYDVKLNLANIGKYTGLLDGFPSKMMNEIKNGGWNCGNCKAKKGECAFVFDLGGKSYRKCCCGSFVFNNPDKNDSGLLLGLLKKELEFA